MCGRFAQHTPLPVLQKTFLIHTITCDVTPSYNIAPSQEVIAVINPDGNRKLGKLYWGLVPDWSKDLSRAAKIINARAETLKEKPSFRNAYQQRRCLIIADGFYEWKKDSRHKQPFYITLPSGVPFAFAGLYETWKGNNGVSYNSCTIITTRASESVQPIHDRMPIILRPEATEDWLNQRIQNAARLDELLHEGHFRDLKNFPVTKYVNDVHNTDQRCIKEAEQVQSV